MIENNEYSEDMVLCVFKESVEVEEKEILYGGGSRWYI
jgi:hypothetical protein